MLFSSLSFLYGFLPAALSGYWLLPFRWKNGWLLAVSLLFYFCGEPSYGWLLPASVLFGYVAGRRIERAEEKEKKRRILVLAAAVLLSVLFLFKCSDSLPFGISFFTFQILGYTVDVYRGRVKAQNSLVDFGTYVTLFPQLIAGPIVRYTDVEAELQERSCQAEAVASGIRTFLCGLAKKVLIANTLGQLVDACGTSAERSVLLAWLEAIAFFFQIYYDFSGYSDMAVGLGRMLGFHLPENFRYPYCAGSVTEFWTRWHITLGSWFRDYVYIPLGGNRVSRGKWIRNVLLVWMLTGIWHGVSWNFVVWGLYFGCFLILEKLLLGRFLADGPGVLRHGYTLLVLIAGMVIFQAESLPWAVGQLSDMFAGAGRIPLAGTESIYYLGSYGRLLVLAVLGAGPAAKKIWEQLSGRAAVLADLLGTVVLLFWITGCLVDGSFHPFLYFRF